MNKKTKKQILHKKHFVSRRKVLSKNKITRKIMRGGQPDPKTKKNVKPRAKASPAASPSASPFVPQGTQALAQRVLNDPKLNLRAPKPANTLQKKESEASDKINDEKKKEEEKRADGEKLWQRYEQGRSKYINMAPVERVREYIKLLKTHPNDLTASPTNEEYLLDVIQQEKDLIYVKPNDPEKDVAETEEEFNTRKKDYEKTHLTHDEWNDYEKIITPEKDALNEKMMQVQRDRESRSFSHRLFVAENDQKEQSQVPQTVSSKKNCDEIKVGTAARRNCDQENAKIAARESQERSAQNYVFTPLNPSLNASIIEKIDKNAEISSSKKKLTELQQKKYSPDFQSVQTIDLTDAEKQKISEYEAKFRKLEQNETEDAPKPSEAETSEYLELKEKIKLQQREREKVDKIRGEEYFTDSDRIKLDEYNKKTDPPENEKQEYERLKAEFTSKSETDKILLKEIGQYQSILTPIASPEGVEKTKEEIELEEKIKSLESQLSREVTSDALAAGTENRKKMKIYESKYWTSDEEKTKFEELKNKLNLQQKAEGVIEKTAEETEYIKKLRNSAMLYPRMNADGTKAPCPYEQYELYTIYQLANSITTTEMANVKTNITTENALIQGIIDSNAGTDSDANYGTYKENVLVSTAANPFQPSKKKPGQQPVSKPIEIKNMAYLTEESQYVDRPIG
jgi:hypothetical protein